MNGLDRNKSTLMNHDGKLFLAAFDHSQIYGVMPGLVDPIESIKRILATDIDGYILNPGIVSILDPALVAKKKIVLRSSLGGSMLGTGFDDHHSIMVSPKQALALGCDAVLIMLVLGGAHDKQSMTDVAQAIDAFHQYSIPVMVEVLNADFTKNNDSNFIRNGVRIAVEIGADFIKAFYCEDFSSVVEGCPVPIVLAGGPKEVNIIDIAQTVVDAGAVGFAFGRNIFQSPEPDTMVASLSKVLRG
jgi:class I fructose-bisphosphate aldolase/fructose-bisphosphate aldolase/2-amino-3,7-dideoxy-D-threo-hept-6-ulosonate synthase